MAMDKEKAIELAIGQIEKQFGKGSIMKLGENSAKINGRGHSHRIYLP